MMGEEIRFSAIILAAGSGKRMGAAVAKQYLPLRGKPLMVYSLEAFDKSAVDEIILVVAPGEIPYCQKEIVDKYHIRKVTHIIEGGKERYDSVYAGLSVVSGQYVMIHDSARAFVTDDIIQRSMEEVERYGAIVVGMPVKDTIKIAGEKGFVSDTPDRSKVWSVQTPQCFETNLIKNAYEALMRQERICLTDDAMVAEQMTDVPVKLIEGSYHNIKVTTPEDLVQAEYILQSLEQEDDVDSGRDK